MTNVQTVALAWKRIDPAMQISIEHSEIAKIPLRGSGSQKWQEKSVTELSFLRNHPEGLLLPVVVFVP